MIKFETLNLRSIFTTESWYLSGETSGSSTGINWETILFIFGMMVMVEGMARVGFFRWLCMRIAKLVNYRVIPLFITFMILSTILAMFIDSITVILFLAAVTIELSFAALEIQSDPHDIIRNFLRKSRRLCHHVRRPAQYHYRHFTRLFFHRLCDEYRRDRRRMPDRSAGLLLSDFPQGA